jgi:hypothetical protein
MSLITRTAVVAIFLLFAALSSAQADEGMWILPALNQLPFDSLKARGLELTAEQIFNPSGGGIADAICDPGSSGSFVSENGLIVTNHHVAFDAIQRQSSPEHNYLENGFYAKTLEEEIPAVGYYVYITKSFEDVTSRVLSVVNDKMTGLERRKALEKIKKILVAEAEKGKDVECHVSEFYGGKLYYLITYFKIRDVRLVFAPPRSIGDYGGEIDNWMWPRHAGDFAFLRAYVAPDGKSADYDRNNVPYKSKTFLKISSRGVTEGDLLMIIGFPGRTNRYESSYSIDRMVNHEYPNNIKTRLDNIAILEAEAALDSANAIKLSSALKGLYNFLKKDQGMMDGFRKSDILERKIKEEAALNEFINSTPALKKKYGRLFPALDSLYKESDRYRDKGSILGWMTWRVNYASFAGVIYKWALEKEKKDLDREPGYQNRDTIDTKQWLEDAQINLVPSADKKILAYYLQRALRLPKEQRIGGVDKIFSGKTIDDTDRVIAEVVESLYSGTALGTAESRLKMFNMSKAELEKLNDPFINFAKALEVDREEMRNRDKAFAGALNKLEPQLISAYADWKKGKLYPDANGTMRVNFGTAKGYSPRDAVSYDYVTTLRGVIEKNTGVDPFDAPAELVEAFKKRDFGRYLDPALADVPVNFLSDNDITNGNSGSAVMNGRGELVGLAFDGNYESMTSDYLFDPIITRTISVDIRYVLFLLDKVYHADRLMSELTIK